MKTKMFATAPHILCDKSPPLGAVVFCTISKWFLVTNMKQIGAVNNV